MSSFVAFHYRSYGTFCIHKNSSIISAVVLPTTEIIEPILTSWLLVCLSVFYFLYGELETLVFLLYLGKIAVNPRRIALLLERHHDCYWCG